MAVPAAPRPTLWPRTGRGTGPVTALATVAPVEPNETQLLSTSTITFAVTGQPRPQAAPSPCGLGLDRAEIQRDSHDARKSSSHSSGVHVKGEGCRKAEQNDYRSRRTGGDYFRCTRSAIPGSMSFACRACLQSRAISRWIAAIVAACRVPGRGVGPQRQAQPCQCPLRTAD